MMCNRERAARTCHAIASRLAVALCEGGLAKAGPYEFAMYTCSREMIHTLGEAAATLLNAPPTICEAAAS
jgi:hypothetical protein